MTELELAYKECRSLTRREARTFYYAFLTLPAAQRRAIYVVYAFCRHCDDAVDTERSKQEKLATLARLHDQLRETYLGSAVSPVFLALADVAEQYDIPQQYFQEVLSGVESDLLQDRYQDFPQLRRYCYQVASVVGLICIHIFGFKDSDAEAHAIDLGLAMQLTNIARDVREDLDFGRIYLPQAEMAQFGYSEEELKAGVVNEAFVNLMRFQAQRAKGYFRNGFQLLPYLSPRSRACPAVLGRLYSRVLDRIELADYDVLHQRIGLSTTEKVRVTTQTWLSSIMPGLSPLPK